MALLENELNALSTALQKGDLFNPSISKSGTFWHIDHSLKVINSIQEALQHSDPSHYQWHFNWIRSVIFLIGTIPRGKAQAPQAVLPPNMVTKCDIDTQLQQVKTNLISISKLPANAHFKHPYFGVLNLKSSLKFLKIHTNHHLKIIRDITKNPV